MKSTLLVLCVILSAALSAPAPKPSLVAAPIAPVVPLSYSYNAYNSFITHPSGVPSVYASPYAYTYPLGYGYNYPYVVV